MASSKCLDKARKQVQTMTIEKKTNESLPLCNCLPSCTSISYSADSSPCEANNSLIIHFLDYYDEAMA